MPTAAIIKHEHLEIIPLCNKHTLSEFNCGHDDLNEFLIEDSKEQMDIMVNVTHICSYKNQILGYMTLSTDKIETKK
ncbi:MAG: hypothetical protein Q8M06_08640 [Methanobacteriaceae archaeon]|nr:hypothetical protein [Methanobacteriaceae archaeon]